MSYPYLPQNREILFVDVTNKFMSEAKKEAELNSTDHAQPTGAVIVVGDQIVGRGANVTAFSHPSLVRLHKKVCIRKLLKVKSGTRYWMCPGCATNKMHAEARAVKNAGVKAHGGDLYLWGHWWCCKPCWDAMISAGIKNVYLYTESQKLFKH